MKKTKLSRIIKILVLGTILASGIFIYRIYHSSLQNSSGNVSNNISVAQRNVNANPIVPQRNPRIGDFKIDADSVISVAIDNNDQKKILFEKNLDKIMLIASITKLMTAAVVLDNYDFSQKVKISRIAVAMGGLLNAGDTFTVDTLFHTMLIGPDNTAAYTFSEMMAKGKFVSLMNLKAKEFGLLNTYYANSVGFGLENHSTANDLIKLSYQLLKKYPLIFKASVADEYDIYDVGGGFHYKTVNGNKLLAENTNFEANIIGGKLGENKAAGGCLVIVLKTPNNNGYVINVILNSKNRFKEMGELIDWIDTAYKW